MKTIICGHLPRAEIMKMRRKGKKVVSHGTYRAKRKPNSPRVATGG
jgi:hypothetical protein